MTRDEYLDAVFEIIKTNQVSDRGLKASTLGNLILTSLGQSWRDFEFPTLKSLLEILSQRSQIRLAADAQNALAVWVAASSAPIQRRVGPPSVRKKVWIAFVSANPRGRRFVSRADGSVRMGLTEPPGPAEQWVEVVPIPEDTQKAWVREFLQESGVQLDGALDTALAQTTWYLDVVAYLQKVAPELASKWQRRRSERVADHVNSWSHSNQLDSEFAFDSSGGRRRTSEQMGSATQTVAEWQARELVLRALAKMSTQELLEIPIPGKYLFPVGRQ